MCWQAGGGPERKRITKCKNSHAFVAIVRVGDLAEVRSQFVEGVYIQTGSCQCSYTSVYISIYLSIYLSIGSRSGAVTVMVRV
jgi:hypothetical protein